MDLFEGRSLADYKGRLLAHIVRVYPGRSRRLGEARVRDIMERSIAVADRWSLASEREIAHYTLMGVAAGSELSSSAHAVWAVPILADRSRTGEQKITRLQAVGRRNGLPFGDERRP